MESQPSPRVAYIWSQQLQDVADDLPSNIGRSSMVHDLIKALDLVEERPLEPDDVLSAPHESDERKEVRPIENTLRAKVIAPSPELGTEACLRRYHDVRYVDYLLKYRPTDKDNEEHDSDHSSSSSSSDRSHRARKRRRTEYHGLEHDCPPFPSLPEYATLIASSTQTACRLLANGSCDISINWDGGRHHAMRNRANGFCYVADAVLGIMTLTKEGKGKNGKRPKVMYLDLDLHYGDGVAQAFLSPMTYPTSIPEGQRPPRPPQVLTLSIHHDSPVFFPPHSPRSGLPKPSTPNPFTLSLPLATYLSPRTYRVVWNNVENIKMAFDPDYIVLQLGVDGLPGDRVGQYGAWGLEEEGGLRWCVQRVKDWGIPLCVLGGGGYDHSNAARAWAIATSVLVGRDLSPDTHIPDHTHFPQYGPSFDLHISPNE